MTVTATGKKDPKIPKKYVPKDPKEAAETLECPALDGVATGMANAKGNADLWLISGKAAALELQPKSTRAPTDPHAGPHCPGASDT